MKKDSRTANPYNPRLKQATKARLILDKYSRLFFRKFGVEPPAPTVRVLKSADSLALDTDMRRLYKELVEFLSAEGNDPAEFTLQKFSHRFKRTRHMHRNFPPGKKRSVNKKAREYYRKKSRELKKRRKADESIAGNTGTGHSSAGAHNSKPKRTRSRTRRKRITINRDDKPHHRRGGREHREHRRAC